MSYGSRTLSVEQVARAPSFHGGSSLSHAVDVSVIVPFSDDEEVVGRLARRIARHLRSLRLEFEIFFADEGSSDNSVALLGWLGKHEIAELRLCSAEPGRGFATAAALARGRVL